MVKLLKNFTLLCFLIFSFAAWAPGARAADATQRVIVVFKQPLFDDDAIKITSQYQSQWKRALRLIHAASIELPVSSIEALKSDPHILRVDPDVKIMAVSFFTPLSLDWCSIFPFLSWCSPNTSRKPKPTPTPTATPTPTPTPTARPTPTPTPTPRPTPTPTPTSTPAPTPTAAATPTPTPGQSQPIPWGVSQIQAPSAWPATRGTGVKVAIIDTGAQISHPDLSANIAGCLSFVAYTTSCNDDNGHGTHVSGIVSALDNSIGVVGVAPQANLYELKVLDYKGSGYLSDIISALDWASINGIQVINMSLGTASDIQSFHDAITAAYNAGIVEVAAAGNSGPGANTVLYPGAYPEVIGVAATDSSNNVPSWSSRGPQIAVAAPGVNIYSTYPTSTYTYLSGTSMASPHVAGTVALREKLHPGQSPASVKSLLESTATALPYPTTTVGSGLVNAYKFVTAP